MESQQDRSDNEGTTGRGEEDNGEVRYDLALIGYSSSTKVVYSLEFSTIENLPALGIIISVLTLCRSDILRSLIRRNPGVRFRCMTFTVIQQTLFPSNLPLKISTENGVAAENQIAALTAMNATLYPDWDESLPFILIVEIES